MSAHESASINSELKPGFTVMAPVRQTAPFVFCSPHSGRVYTRRFLEQSRLDPLTLRKSEDCFVDELFADAAALGAPMISARFPRAYLDVNREPYELDPELFHEVLPDHANAQSARVIGGLGTIARIVADGEDIYRARLRLSDAIERIERLYKPFHATLADLITTTVEQFGFSVLVDCHSMPSALMAQGGGRRPDFVVGDRFGTSCDARLSRFVKEVVAGLGYDVQMNRPYAGGYITEHYGRPNRGVHAIQLEINRGLYLDETKITKTRGFDGLRVDVANLLERLFAEVPGLFERRAAAE